MGTLWFLCYSNFVSAVSCSAFKLVRHQYIRFSQFFHSAYLCIPVIGGFIADRLLGQKRTIIIGGLILSLSYFCLAVISSDSILIFSLAGVAAGAGLFKPNISSLLGNAYSKNSTQREKGFTIFFMGITSGIILGCTLPSYFNTYFGWPVSFFSAAIGLMIGLSIFIYGIKRYPIEDYSPFQYNLKKILQSIATVIFLWISSFYILSLPMLANIAFTGIVVLSAVYFFYSIKYSPPEEARNNRVIGLLCLISVIFWAFYFQMFLSFTLFLSRTVEPSLWGLPFPPPYYVSIQSIGTILFGIYLAHRTKPYIAHHKGIQFSKRFFSAMICMLIAFILITALCHFDTTNQLISPIYLIPVYLFISLAELLLYPVGMAAITVLASRNKVSTMMGIFLVSLGIGGFLAGKLAELAAISTHETAIALLKAQYSAGFSHILYVLIVALVICSFLNQKIKSLLTVSSNNPINFPSVEFSENLDESLMEI